MPGEKLQCEMEDGSWWEIPLNVVIDHVARLQMVQDVEELRRQVTQIAKDETEIIRWAEEHMDWLDLKEYATQIKPPIEPDYSAYWRSGMKRVVTEK